MTALSLWWGTESFSSDAFFFGEPTKGCLLMVNVHQPGSMLIDPGTSWSVFWQHRNIGSRSFENVGQQYMPYRWARKVLTVILGDAQRAEAIMGAAWDIERMRERERKLQSSIRSLVETWKTLDAEHEAVKP